MNISLALWMCEIQTFSYLIPNFSMSCLYVIVVCFTLHHDLYLPSFWNVNQHPYIKVLGLFLGGFHLLLALCHNIRIDVFVQHFIWSMFWTFYLVFLLCTCTLAMSLLQPPSNFKYYLLFSGTRITTFKSNLFIVDSYSIPPQLLLIIRLIIPTHKKDGWEGNLLSHVWNMLVFGPTLHHPSTKHQALVENIKMQHLANLLEKTPQKSTIIKVDMKVSYSPFNMALNFF